MAKIGQIISWIEELAPRKLAAEWDNVGLMLGDPGAETDKVLVALDCTPAVAEEAIEQGAGLLVTHHPLIFRPLKNLRFDTAAGRLLARLIQNNIAVYSAHTNLDSAEKGINATLARALNLQDIQVLEPGWREEYIKIVVFVPAGHEEAVRLAMAEAGAGHIGNYSHCTFQTQGTGTFLPLTGTNPYLGQVGQLERAEEYRLETICPKSKLKRVLQAMLKVHPYEEVAYDLYPLLNEGPALGLGRIGLLSQPLTLAQLAARIKEIVSVARLRLGGSPEQTVKKVALCSGSGASLAARAKMQGADVLLTGDVKYHEAQDMLQMGLSFIDAGHFATEAFYLPYWVRELQQKAAGAGAIVEIIQSTREKEPWQEI
ncbi:Nif3-like dinuclear metal center hexameric protein [Carboxydocella sp. ULO1]|uniref:Nif3-like dinuclear metal center hexameric protein n=1 Tax=Carboxydocella sp. ULO1 TaxID=1926599 RepID=UPI0009AE9259|nr:Nif3-like dinuclear metal center hexameric protein [Carboxydocella sp. ULO1]GAW28415.1 Nif3-like dinuclear metal center hexameric protein [Carboxydocella sp. ULO1]